MEGGGAARPTARLRRMEMRWESSWDSMRVRRERIDFGLLESQVLFFDGSLLFFAVVDVDAVAVGVGDKKEAADVGVHNFAVAGVDDGDSGGFEVGEGGVGVLDFEGDVGAGEVGGGF